MHIVYNRIDNDLKVISVNNDYKRNIKACKKLKDRYGLTYGKTGKEKVNRPKLHGPDKLKYEIHDTLKAILPKCRTFGYLEKRLKQGGISIKYKYRSGAEECEENIQGVSFENSGCSFKGSESDKKFSYGKLKKVLETNMKLLLKEIIGQDLGRNNPYSSANVSLLEPPIPPQPVKHYPTIRGVELTDEQDKILRSGGHIYLENMERKDGAGKFSAYVFLNDDKKKVFFLK